MVVLYHRWRCLRGLSRAVLLGGFLCCSAQHGGGSDTAKGDTGGLGETPSLPRVEQQHRDSAAAPEQAQETLDRSANNSSPARPLEGAPSSSDDDEEEAEDPATPLEGASSSSDDEEEDDDDGYDDGGPVTAATVPPHAASEPKSSPGLRGARPPVAASNSSAAMRSPVNSSSSSSSSSSDNNKRPSPPATPLIRTRDESPEVLAFAGLNAVVLLLSVRSLRKQQRAALERTMGSLCAPIAGKPVSSQTATSYVDVEGAGRKMSSFMASTGQDLKRAVTQELSKAGKEASSLALDLKRAAEATVAQGVKAAADAAGGSEQKMK